MHTEIGFQKWGRIGEAFVPWRPLVKTGPSLCDWNRHCLKV